MYERAELAVRRSAICFCLKCSCLECLRSIPGHVIIISQLVVHEQHAVELQPSQTTSVGFALRLKLIHSGFPFTLDVHITQSSETHTPPFEDNDFDGWLTLAVASFPLTFRPPVASSIES